MGPACTLLSELSDSELALLSNSELAELESLAEIELGLECPPNLRNAPVSLKEFMRDAWHVIEPTTQLTWNWHLDLFCKRGEKWVRTPNDRLLVNIPPGCCKSIFWAVMLPCWTWTFWPECRYLFTAYADTRATQDSIRRRQVLSSDWYKKNFGDIGFSDDQNLKTRFSNAAGGWMFAVGINGQATGEHPDKTIGDDIHKATETHASVTIEADVTAWRTAFANRGSTRGVSQCIIGQRISKDDISDALKDSFEHLCLPMEYEPGRETNSPDDPRTEEGELLWPELFPQSAVDEARARGNSYFSSQYQQRPPDTLAGVEWPASYWEGIYAEEHHWPDRFEWGVIAVDPSKGKSTKKGDYSAIVFVGLAGGKLWVDADLERRPVEKIVNDGIEMALHYAESLHGFAVETNGFQELLADEFERQTKLRGMMPLPMFTVENRVNKKLRIGRLGPYFARRAIVVRNNQGGQLLVKQCSQFSQAESAGVHDDGPDCLEVAIRVLLHLQGIDVDAQQTPETGGTMIQN